jgi:hypothetical protein
LSDDSDGATTKILVKPTSNASTYNINKIPNNESEENVQEQFKVTDGSNTGTPLEGSAAGTCTSTSTEEEKSVVSVDAIPEISPRSIPFDNLPILKYNDLGGYHGFHKIQDPYTTKPVEFSSNGNNIDYSSNNEDAQLQADVEANHEWNADYNKLSFDAACASEDVNVEDLRAMLRRNPEVAAIKNAYGDYPAHIFANNDAVVYGEYSEENIAEFLFELYCAFPGGKCTYKCVRVPFCSYFLFADYGSKFIIGFLAEGSSGQIPFASAIVDWIDDCHQLYRRDDNEVYRVSELKTLSKSDRVVNGLCVHAKVQLLTRLPDRGKSFFLFRDSFVGCTSRNHINSFFV